MKNKIKNKKHQIEAVSDNGYCLKRILDENKECSWLGKYFEYYKQIDSTNNRGKVLGKEVGMHGAFVIADEQTDGKGRRGRVWESSDGTSLLMSIVLQPHISPEKASMLTLVNALAVRKAIETVTRLHPLIKWPNDLVINGRKLAGILTEMRTEGMNIRYIVIGTGINVNTRKFPKQLQGLATSLYLENGFCYVAREDLIVEYLKNFEMYYDIFMKTQDLTLLQEEYEKNLVSMGKEVRIVEEQDIFGICEGITAGGDLRVRLQDGSVREVLSGEVSVRGVYGYV